MFAPVGASDVFAASGKSDVAPSGRSAVMCSALVPKAHITPKGTSLAKQTSRSATPIPTNRFSRFAGDPKGKRNTSFKKTPFVGRQKTFFCWRKRWISANSIGGAPPNAFFRAVRTHLRRTGKIVHRTILVAPTGCDYPFSNPTAIPIN